MVRTKVTRRRQVHAGPMAIISMAIAALCCTLLLFAYNPEQDQLGGPVPTRWQNKTVTWNLNHTIGSNVHTSGGDDVGTVLGKAFATWQQTQLNGQVANGLTVTRGSDTSVTDPNSSDCVNVISFVPSSAVNFPTGAIAFTQIVTSFGPPPTSYPCTTPPNTRMCNLASCIVDADIVFNPKEQFSTTTPPLMGDFDVQPVATHEIGHLLGLDHSGIAGAIMYPFGDAGGVQQRTLAVDDTVGVAFLYPAANFAPSTGTLSGKVIQSGSGIFAAHIIAVDATTGDAVVDGLTNPDGTYNLVGVPPRTYNLLVLPLSGVYDITDFGGWACGYDETQNAPPCCDPSTDPNCKGKPVPNPTNYTGTFH